MAGTQANKIRLLYVKKILEQMTDEQHPMNTTEILKALKSYGIESERKTLYSDIEALQAFGVDIISGPSKKDGYYVGSREFELPELKLLVDSVQSSKFITSKKSLELIKKIEGLCNRYDAKQLNGQVYVKNRIKTMNESIYYNVDVIHNAIDIDSEICFKYFEYDISKKRVFKHNGMIYEISPYVLTWDDENYYMVGYDKKSGIIKHYRVDKMCEISINNNERQGKELFDKIDMSEYTNRLFSMFGGQMQEVTIRFSNRLAGVVFDRFGKQIIMMPDGDEHFIINTHVAVSPQFFSWIFSFGQDVKILAPQALIDGMKEHINKVMALYK